MLLQSPLAYSIFYQGFCFPQTLTVWIPSSLVFFPSARIVVKFKVKKHLVLCTVIYLVKAIFIGVPYNVIHCAQPRSLTYCMV